MKKTLALLFALFVLISNIGCGQTEPSKSIVGTWKVQNYEQCINLVPWNGTAYDCFDEIFFFPCDLTFYNDGTLSGVCITGRESEDSNNMRTVNFSGTYKLIHDGSAILLSVNGGESGEHEIKLSGNTLRIMGSKGKFEYIYGK